MNDSGIYLRDEPPPQPATDAQAEAARRLNAKVALFQQGVGITVLTAEQVLDLRTVLARLWELEANVSGWIIVRDNIVFGNDWTSDDDPMPIIGIDPGSPAGDLSADIPLSMAPRLTNQTEGTMDTQELLTFAQLVNRHYQPTQPIPKGWQVVDERHGILTGVDFLVFGNPAQDAVCLAIKGVDPTVKESIGVILRRIFGYATAHARYVKSVFDRYPATTRRILAGHSGGGGLASALSAELGCESALFNSGRNEKSFLNDGRKQTVVTVKGDVWSDPSVRPALGGQLPGTQIWLEARLGENKHVMSTIIAALERLISSGG